MVSRPSWTRGIGPWRLRSRLLVIGGADYQTRRCDIGARWRDMMIVDQEKELLCGRFAMGRVVIPQMRFF
jgi:hypothetical protein